MKSNYTLILLFCCFLISSCTKDEILFIPDQEENINQSYIHNLVSLHKSQYLIKIEENKPNFIKNQGKYLIHIAANTLLDAQNKPIVGQVKLQFDKLGDDKSDFIITPSLVFNNQATAASSFHLKITTLDGKSIKLEKPIEVYVATLRESINDKINLYFQDKNSRWELFSDDLKFEDFEVPLNETTFKLTGVKTLITSTEQTFAVAQITSTINNNIGLSAKADVKFKGNNTLVYFRSSNGKLIIRLDEFKDGKFSSPVFSNQTQLDGHIIAISDIGNENYYFDQVPAIIEKSNLSFNINLKETSIKDIKAAIQSL